MKLLGTPGIKASESTINLHVCLFDFHFGGIWVTCNFHVLKPGMPVKNRKKPKNIVFTYNHTNASYKDSPKTEKSMDY